MTEWNPFTATVEVFEQEGTCRVTGAWQVDRARYYEMDQDERVLPDGIDIGYCLVGGIRAAFNRHYHTETKSIAGYPEYHPTDAIVPRHNEREYLDVLVFAALHLSDEDKLSLVRYHTSGNTLDAFNTQAESGGTAESILIDWNDRVVGNHSDPAKDTRVLDFLRSLAPLWSARETVSAS